VVDVPAIRRCKCQATTVAERTPCAL
jgi:hypothetical protein